VDDYIHRVGRTARGGKRGTGITLITQFDIERVLSLEGALNIKLEEIKFNEEKVLEDMSSLSKLMRKIKVIMAEDGTTEWM
jgi:ATP-dependent RNA helicase DDX49/DBP8